MDAPLTCAVLVAAGTDPADVERTLASITGVRETLTVASRADALERATQPWVAVVRAGATLADDAFTATAPLLYSPETAVIYTDERSRVAGTDDAVEILKPGWSPRLFQEGDYIGDLCAVRVSAARDAGGFTHDSTYDLVERMVANGATPVHVPVVGIANPHDAFWPPSAEAELVWRAFAPHAPHEPVTIIIPTRDRVDLLRNCIESIEAHTDYESYEIVVVDNGSTDPGTLRYLDEFAHRVIRHAGPFNFSDLINVAVANSTNPLLLLLNNDTEVTQEDWLSRLVDETAAADVGAVGCRLVGLAGEAQHEGIALGICGYPAMNLDLDHFLRLDEAARDVVAVTAACVLGPRAAFESVDGFDHELAVGYGDVDFCLRLRAAGYRIIYTPRVTIRHLGQASRGTNPHPDDDALFAVRWPSHRARSIDSFTHPRIEGFAPLNVSPVESGAWPR